MRVTAERRKRARMGLVWPVRLTWADGARSVDSNTRNLSSQGFYCIAEEPFEVGDWLDCVLALPQAYDAEGSGYCLCCRVEVVRVEAVDQGFGIACRIEGFSLRRRLG
jgi:hypothetical protein